MDNIELLIKKSTDISQRADDLATQASSLAENLQEVAIKTFEISQIHNHNIISLLTIFILACIVGYHIVWRVTPALHTPLMAVTNAISGIIIVGAMIAAGSSYFQISNIFGLIAIILASINIFGGFFVTYRMLSMFRKR